MRRIFMGLMLTSMMVFGTGCLGAVTRAASEVKGSTSDVTAVPGSSTGEFGKFQGVSITPIKCELGSLVPAEFNSELAVQLRKFLTQGKEAVFAGGQPTLTIEPHVMWFKKSNPVFPDKYAIVLYYLSADGADLGRLLVVTHSEASGTGISDLAENMAKNLGKYFKKHGKAKAGEKVEDDK